MNRRIAFSLIAASLLASGSAFAQSTTVQGTVGVGPALEVPDAVITAIPRSGRSVAVDERIVVGEPLPPSVEFRTVPNHVEYGYAVVNDRRVIVEPRTRKVIRVID